MAHNTTLIQGQESWTAQTAAVEAALTVNGAMLAPVRFTLPVGTVVEPYYVSPWHNEDLSTIEPELLKPLRGDFFCLPFGGSNTVGSEIHPPHGEAACAPWHLREKSHGSHNHPEGTITVELAYSACPGRVVRQVELGETAPWIISRTTVTGFSGDYPLGYHATLKGAEVEGLWRIHTGTFDVGMTEPAHQDPAAGGEYYALQPGALFEKLDAVPTRWKDPATTNCSAFPARDGFIDILALYRRRSATQPLAERLGWTVAVHQHDGYLWYSIKDAAVLPATVIWMENRGRHGAPWSGRNSCIGIEETCTFFAAGRTASIRENAINRQGIATAITLSPNTPTTIVSVQGVLEVEDPTARILSMHLDDRGHAVFTDDRQRTMTVDLDLRAVFS